MLVNFYSRFGGGQEHRESEFVASEKRAATSWRKQSGIFGQYLNKLVEQPGNNAVRHTSRPDSASCMVPDFSDSLELTSVPTGLTPSLPTPDLTLTPSSLALDDDAPSTSMQRSAAPNDPSAGKCASLESKWMRLLASRPENITCEWDDDIRAKCDKYRDLRSSQVRVRQSQDYLLYASDFSSALSLVPSRSICDSLLVAYVNSFESIIRILHIPTFTEEYKAFWLNSENASDVFIIKLLLATALGEHFTIGSAEDASSPSTQAAVSIFHCRQWFHSKATDEARLDIDILQVGCLLLLCRQTGFASNNSVWLSEESLVRMAMKVGLHQEPRTHFPTMSDAEAEIRRRLWASILELSLQTSLDAGLPPPVSPNCYDTHPPSNYIDDDLDEVLPANGPRPRGVFTHSTSQVLITETHLARQRILMLLHSPGGMNSSYQESMELAAELARACNANLELMQSFSSDVRNEDSTGPTEFQIKVLDLWTRRFLLALVSPFADRATSDFTYYYARKTRMEVSTLLLSYPLSENGVVASSGNQYAQLCAYGGGVFSNTLKQATRATCQDLMDALAENTFLMTEREVQNKLYTSLEDSIATYELRVQLSQQCMHEYIAFVCAKAEIDAILRKLPAEPKIKQASAEALDRCCSVLEENSPARGTQDYASSEAFKDMMARDTGIWADFQ